MTYFLTGLLSALIGGFFASLAMAALQINRNENRDDDDKYGALEGAHPISTPHIKSLNRGEVM